MSERPANVGGPNGNVGGPRLRPARIAIAAVVGGLVCLVLDHLHATHGVLWYPRPVVWQQAWWVFPLFAAATAATIGGARLLRTLFRATRPSTSLGMLVGDALAFITAYAATSFLHANAAALALVLFGFWVARVAQGLPGWAIAFCVATAICGCAVELTISKSGGFYYHHADLGGVPYWLPGIYLFVGVLGVQLERAVSDGDGAR